MTNKPTIDVTEFNADLRSLPASARRLLAQCVEHQELIRTSVSKAIWVLEDRGFVRVHDASGVFERRFVITPTLAGEEALEAFDSVAGGR